MSKIFRNDVGRKIIAMGRGIAFNKKRGEQYRPALDKYSLQYYRFITHLKFLAKRVFSGAQSIDEVEDEMQAMIKKKYAAASDCANKIAAFVEKNYNYKVSADEKFYLTIHIAKVITK